MFGIEQRNLTDELMDDPGLEPKLHQKALSGLRRINWFTRAYRPIIKQVLQLNSDARQPTRVLDIACGAGDLLCAIGRAASGAGVPIHLFGQDISCEAVKIANQNASRSGQEITFNVRDVFDMEETDSYDVVCCSLFLHHLTTQQAITLLRLMKRAARQMVLVTDLKRTVLGYLYAVFGPRLLTTSRIVHVDAVKSVQGAFARDEIEQLMQEADLKDAEIENFWPQRYLLSWTKKATTINVH